MKTRTRAWIEQVFRSKMAKKGGVVRRKLSSIDTYASREAFVEAVKVRGYHIVQHGDQWLVFCDSAHVAIVT